MKLTEAIKEEIKREYNEFKAKLYAGKSLEERKELDQFFTPPEITFQMIEGMDCDSLEDKTILDPTCGSGNLLIACLIAGAKMENLYGNDYDGRMVKICRERLRDYTRANNIEVSDLSHIYANHIHRGNAMQKMCLTEFNSAYNKYYDEAFIDNLKYAQGKERYDALKKKRSVDEWWKAENDAVRPSVAELSIWG